MCHGEILAIVNLTAANSFFLLMEVNGGAHTFISFTKCGTPRVKIPSGVGGGWGTESSDLSQHTSGPHQ